MIFSVHLIYHQEKIVIKSGDEVILEKKRAHMIPSEMETLKINKEKLSQIKEDISICVEEV